MLYDAIVVGAGASGLSCAAKLAVDGLNVVVLEARDRVGGRLRAGELAGLPVDLGGMWVGPGQDRLIALLQAYQLRTYPTWLDGRNILELGERQGEGQREDLAVVLDEAEREAFETLFVALEELAAHVGSTAPWAAADARALDDQTFASWLDVRRPPARVAALYRLLCESVLCCQPSQLSMLFLAHYLAGGGGLRSLISAEGGAQQDLVHGGLFRLPQLLADGLHGRVVFDAPVTAISQDADTVAVVAGSDVFHGRQVVVALPPPLAGAIAYEPALPAARRALTARSPMGSAIKAWIAYPRPFWRDGGLNGFVLRESAEFGPMFDVSPPDQPLGVLSGFFDARLALKWSDLGRDARRAAVIEEAVRCFGPAAADPLDYAETDWTAERWSAGCYGAVVSPGVLSTCGSALRGGFGRLHWAGTEAATRWAGYVEGAIRAGEAAADAVMVALAAEKVAS